MAHLMVDKCVVVDVLALVGNDAAITPAFGPLTLEGKVKHVARDAIVQCNDIVINTAVGLLVYVDIAHPRVLGRCLLQAVKVKTGVLTHEGFYHLRTQEVAVVSGIVTEQEALPPRPHP